ncbi:hypothetical protein ACQCT3_00925 [Sutcliffiella horikoshii]|uniref:hypothetical protein n=1 Tax=Sutcliffiella horikoshii TaxID=79883 RepID=UPI003CF80E51
MNKTISITYKSLFFLAISTIFTIVLLTFLPTVLSYLSDDSDVKLSAILSVIGNISGGLIGGIVAYIVAAYQVSKSQEHNNQINLKQSYVNLCLLLDEIEYNQKVFKSSANQDLLSKKVDHLTKNLATDQWMKISPSFADTLNNSDFQRICKLYRNISFICNNPETVSEQFINSNNAIIDGLIKNIHIALEEVKRKLS